MLGARGNNSKDIFSSSSRFEAKNAVQLAIWRSQCNYVYVLQSDAYHRIREGDVKMINFNAVLMMLCNLRVANCNMEFTETVFAPLSFCATQKKKFRDTTFQYSISFRKSVVLSSYSSYATFYQPSDIGTQSAYGWSPKLKEVAYLRCN